MSVSAPDRMANRVLAILRAHQVELSQSGIRHMSLFGSVARGDAGPASDVDLAVELDPEAGIGLIALSALERRLAALVGSRVDLLTEPVEKMRLRDNINRDRIVAF